MAKSQAKLVALPPSRETVRERLERLLEDLDRLHPGAEMIAIVILDSRGYATTANHLSRAETLYLFEQGKDTLIHCGKDVEDVSDI